MTYGVEYNIFFLIYLYIYFHAAELGLRQSANAHNFHNELELNMHTCKYSFHPFFLVTSSPNDECLCHASVAAMHTCDINSDRRCSDVQIPLSR